MNLQKAAIIAVFLLLAVFSVTRVASFAADADKHTHSIVQTEDKISTVITLSGGAAGTSATLSLLPGDLCTPLAEQLAELATYFLLILSALYLEKFLITLSGYITFGILFPLACILVCVAIATGKKTFYSMAAKIGLVGLIIFIIVPASVTLSDMIYRTQEEQVQSTISEYNDLNIQDDSDGGMIGDLTTITTTTIDKITSFISDLMESLAVMIVTACIVPLLVFAILVWIFKTVFAANVLTIDEASIDNIIKKLSAKK